MRIIPQFIAVVSAIAVLALGGVASAQPAPSFDHLKCYVIKDPLKAKHTVTLTPEQVQFPVETGCLVVAPAKLLCVDVAKTDVVPPSPFVVDGNDARDYLCYKLKCPKLGIALPVRDQFGERDVLVKVPKLLCAPADKVLPEPTPTRTPEEPTPTPTRTPEGCSLVAPKTCSGECPNPADLCVPRADDTGCECIPPSVPCGPDPAAFQCAGDCPDPTFACLFNPSAGDCRCEPPELQCGGAICNGLCPSPNQQCHTLAGTTGCGC